MVYFTFIFFAIFSCRNLEKKVVNSEKEIYGTIDSIYIELYSSSNYCDYNRISLFTSIKAKIDTTLVVKSLFYKGCDFTTNSLFILKKGNKIFNLIPVSGDSLLELTLKNKPIDVEFTVQEDPFSEKLFDFINEDVVKLNHISVRDSLETKINLVSDNEIVVKYFFDGEETKKRNFDANDFIDDAPELNK